MVDTDEHHTTDDTTAQERARDLLRTTETCTLATASSGGVPEAATVRFVHDGGYDIGFNTATTYRKYERLTANPRVAVVVDGDELNLQLEGVATELAGQASERIRDRYVEKYGPSEYLTHEDSVCFRIETDWGRLLLDGSFPPEYAMLVGEGETEPH